MDYPIKASVEVLQKASDKFWGFLAEHYPEVMWGDLAPDELIPFDLACEEVINSWLKNHPVNIAYQLNEENEKANYTEVVVVSGENVFTPVRNKKEKELMLYRYKNEFPEKEIAVISMKAAKKLFPMLKKYFTDDGEYNHKENQ